MKINTSYLVAGLAVVAIGLWFLVNAKEAQKEPPRPKTTITVEKTVPTVVFEYRDAVEHQNKFELFGRTEANREVSIAARTIGTCLLYTSPSPRDRQKSRMPSSA